MKAVLPRNENKHLSLSVAHAVHMKESTPTFKVCWKKNVTNTTSGTYVLT